MKYWPEAASRSSLDDKERKKKSRGFRLTGSGAERWSIYSRALVQVWMSDGPPRPRFLRPACSSAAVNLGGLLEITARHSGS